MNIVILAAGMGKRMRSQLPKVLQPLAKKPMLHHVLEKARKVEGADRLIVVVGHGADVVKASLADQDDVTFALQAQQLGTGHAVMQALEHCEDDEPTLVLLGDVPLIETETLNRLVEVSGDEMGLLTVKCEPLLKKRMRPMSNVSLMKSTRALWCCLRANSRNG